MLALAQFIMSSRIRASLVAFAGNLLPLLSPATVVLVTVRKGFGEGALVAFWAALPLAAMFYVSEVNSLLVWASLASIVVVLLAALVLRFTASWQLTLLGTVILSALSVTAMGAMSEDVALLRVAFQEMLGQMRLPVEHEPGLAGQAQMEAGKPEGFQLGEQFVLGLLAWVVAMGAVGSLLLGRWWQALLYNPGGFAQEFQALRIRPPVALVLVAGMASCYLLSSDYAAWGNLLGLPLLLSGFALVHHLVAVSHIGPHWLAVFYIGLIFLLGPLSVILLGLGLVDSVLDLRSRWAGRSGEV